MSKLYLLRYAYTDATFHDRHGLLRPNGVYLGQGKIDYTRHAWTFKEAADIRDRQNSLSGAGSHWIIQEKDA